MGWGKAVAYLLAVLSKLLDLWKEGKPSRDEHETEKERMERRLAVFTGDRDAVQRELDRLRSRRRAAGSTGGKGGS